MIFAHKFKKKTIPNCELFISMCFLGETMTTYVLEELHLDSIEPK